jgi:hypothetical protein
MATTFDPAQESEIHKLSGRPSNNGQSSASLSQSASGPDFWHKTAAARLRKQRLPLDEAWTLYWAKRDQRKSLARLCKADDSPLRWGLLAQSITPATQALLDLADAAGRNRVRPKQVKEQVQPALSQWIDQSKTATPAYDLGVSSLATAHLLAAYGASIGPVFGWQLLNALTELARRAADWNLGPDAAAEDILAAQLLGAELPLTLAYLFSEMRPLRELAAASSQFTSESMLELLNGQGLPRAVHLDALRPLVACWTRCQVIADHVKEGRLAKSARRQFKWLFRQALRWTAPDGTLLLSNGAGEPWSHELLHAALRVGGAKQDQAAAAALLGDEFAKAKRGGSTRKAPYNCEWAGLAVMRRKLASDAAVVAIDYSKPAMALDVWAEGRRLLGGNITAESAVDGKSLRPTSSWEELCWFKDKDVNYLELCLPLEGDARLERQIMLALRDKFVLIVDHLRSPQSAPLAHAFQAPLGPGLLFCGEGETRDALLVDGQPLARLMPLALPEWRTDPRIGELSYAAGAVGHRANAGLPAVH